MLYSRLFMRCSFRLALVTCIGGGVYAQQMFAADVQTQDSAPSAVQNIIVGAGDEKHPSTPPSSNTPTYKPLTWHGITLYGILDSGVSHQTHGTPWNSNAPQTGVSYEIAAAGRESITHLSESGLSQSMIGIKGSEKLADGYNIIFNLAPGVNPLSLRFTNSLQSLVAQNGRTVQQQTTNYDSPRAGRIDNGDAYFGLNTKYGTLTFGRQNSLVVDNIAKYDPNAGSYAFSLVGWIGNLAGGGSAEDLKLDSSIKYVNQIGRYRIGGLCQFKGHNAVFSPNGVYGTTTQLNLGGDYHNLSVDFTYDRTYDQISASPLSASQVATLPANSLAATISDTQTYAVMSKYAINARTTVFGGYANMRYSNPSSPLTAGITTIGGYVLSFLNQTAFTVPKTLQVYWGGSKYSLTKKLDLIGAYYGWRQNSYLGNGCSNNSSSKCSGNRNDESVNGIYKLTSHIDLYAGLDWSNVSNGLSAGYLYTSNLSVMAGTRIKF